MEQSENGSETLDVHSLSTRLPIGGVPTYRLSGLTSGAAMEHRGRSALTSFHAKALLHGARTGVRRGPPRCHLRNGPDRARDLREDRVGSEQALGPVRR